jgi:hypothetical protein
MKKMLLLVCLFFSLSTLKAQSEAETLEWMNVKKIDISLTGSNANTVKFADQLELTSSLIKISSKDGAWAAGNWNTVKEVKIYNSYDIQIVFNLTYEKQPLFINLRIYDSELKKKFVKALKHMATLKGAKLIDSDLF